MSEGTNTFLEEIFGNSKAFRYVDNYFFTKDAEANYSKFKHVGPFYRPLPTQNMIVRANALIAMTPDEKNVKILVTL